MSKLKKPTDDRKLMDRIAPDPPRGPLLGIVATTYEMQPEFFETDFVPTLFGLGAWDDRNWTSRIALEKSLAELDTATVFLDARPYRGRPRSLRVEVRPVLLDHGRILHAKVVLVVYQQAIRLIVGSANLTEPGYRRNREVVAVLNASAKRPGEASLIAQAIQDLNSLAFSWMTPGARQLCDFALTQLKTWKVASVEANEWFVWGGGAFPLWRQFLDRWPSTDKIGAITIVSPFWSEETPDGPISAVLSELRTAGSLASQVELRLLTEAAPDKQASYKPKLPVTFRTFDAASLGISAFASAVDPRVPPEEAGMGEDFTRTRNLHAKIVLIEGSDTSLAYIGSANFTNRGWGFVSDPLRSNIEAGVVVRRSGNLRAGLHDLLPPVTGAPVPLAGAAAGRLALADPASEDLPWPGFIREVLLSTSKRNAELLELVAVVTSASVLGSWELRYLTVDGKPQEIIVSVDKSISPQAMYRVALSEQSLARLLREQEIQVIWWECPAGRAIPINVAQAARDALPISPSTWDPLESTCRHASLSIL